MKTAVPTFDQLPQVVCELMEQVSSLTAIVRKYEEKPTAEEKPVYMSVSQAAKYLNRANQTIYQMIWKNILPHYKVNGKPLFKESDLEAYVLSKKVKTIEDIAAEVDAKLKNK